MFFITDLVNMRSCKSRSIFERFNYYDIDILII